MTGTSANSDSIDRLCENCGATFSTFLHEMAAQNEKVVCPNCRKDPTCMPDASAGLPETAIGNKTVH